MAFDDDMFDVWLREYRNIVGDDHVVRHNPGAYNPNSFRTSQYEMYQAYSSSIGTYGLPSTYVGEIQGFDLFVDSRTKTYMVKYNSYYVLIAESLFDLAYTEMDAGELNLFFCQALFDNIDITQYLTEYLKNKKHSNYMLRNGVYSPLTTEERELRQKQREEEIRIIREQEEREIQQQLEFLRESEAESKLKKSLSTDFWGLLLIEDVI